MNKFWSLSLVAGKSEKKRYFEEQVLRKTPYIQVEWCERIVQKPLKKNIQDDRRVRYWGLIPEFGGRILRVVTLEDGKTIHNAFFDRDFKEEEDR